MKRIDFLKVLERTLLAMVLIGGCVSVMAQQQPPARAQSAPQRAPLPYGSAANAAAGAKPSGTVTGYVYWQMNVFQPQADCQGLTVKIITVSKSGMPLQLLSTTSTLTANGPVTDDSAQGTPKYMLCSYSFSNMPENVSVRALLYGQPSIASVAIPAAFQIPGGNCNSTPSSALSFILTGGPMLCGNGAYNINFKLTAVPPRRTAPATLQPSAAPVGMLAGTQQPGMLAPGTTQSAPTQANSGTLLGNRPANPETPATVPSPPQNSSSGTGVPQNISASSTLVRKDHVGSNPQSSSSTRALTNADVAKMAKSGLPESVIIRSIGSTRSGFDLSPSGCSSLRAAGVSASVLSAMGDGSHTCSSQGTAATAPMGSHAVATSQALSSNLTGSSHDRFGVTPTQFPGVTTSCLTSNFLVSGIRLEATTGKDDLRGGDNNLNVEVHFTDGTFQTAQNVNNGANWPNLSVRQVEIPLAKPVLANRIKEFRLIHNAQANFPNSEDNWEMLQVRFFAESQNGNQNVANFGFNKFTGTNPELTVGMGCAPAPGKINGLYFAVSTGSDDLKGDFPDAGSMSTHSNNLNVRIYFFNGPMQQAFNVNGGVNWANRSQHHFTVYLEQPRDLSEIERILLDLPDEGNYGVNDNWNMDSVQVTAIGNGINKLIATHGFYRFTAENHSLSLDMVTGH